MRWYKHFTDAHADTKIKKLVREFGADGYAVYFYCLELIAGTIDGANITFELEDDAELVGEYLKVDTLQVERIMKKCIDLDLFGVSSSGRVTCMKMAKFFDADYTRNPELKKLITGEGFKKIVSRQSADNPQTGADISRQIRLDKIRLEENRKDKKLSSGLSPEEKTKLEAEYGSGTTEKAIQFLADYKAEKGYKTKSDYLTIRRWVIGAVQEKQTKIEGGKSWQQLAMEQE